MVTVLKVGQLKYKINQRDHGPPHVHVEGGGASVRINLLNLEVMDRSTDFSSAMVRKILIFVSNHRDELIEKWREYHEKN